MGKRITLVLLAVLSLLLTGLFGAENPPVEIWAVPSVHKVRPEDPVQESNLVWSSTAKTVSVAGARNEHVPFQLVLSTPPPASRYDRGASGFFVEISDLESPQGRISRQQVRFYLQHVVLCYGKSSPVGETGFWPDPLVPLTDPFGMEAPFRSFLKNRAVWVDFLVPKDAQAGIYTGTLTVTQHQKPVGQMTVHLRVYDFSLPEETHLLTYMGISRQQLASYYGLERSHPRIKQLLRHYYDFLYRNRMEPWFHDLLEPEITEEGSQLGVHFDEELYRHYLEELRGKRVVLEAAPRALRRGHEPFSEAFNRRLESYLRQVVEYFRQNGWLEKLVFNSPIDEPNTAEQYAETRRWAELVHQAAPGVPFLVTESPVPDRAEWGTLVGFAQNFAVHGNALNRLQVREAIRQEQEKGGEITWYISCDQHYPQPNYFIDASPMDPVMIPWITWRYGMDGILYWSVNYWSQTADPWLDPVTFLSGFLCSRGYVLNGEGSLLYPGDASRRHTGQQYVEGPVSSLRFELLREGIEDYEYLWLLKSLGEGELADRLVREMVVDVRAFSRNLEQLFRIREEIAERIAAKAARGASVP